MVGWEVWQRRQYGSGSGVGLEVRLRLGGWLGLVGGGQEGDGRKEAAREAASEAGVVLLSLCFV